ncbi:MAG: MgtC/SapB family protein [Euryarchaeota archaeon]|nr:MgtC/SapB family protein [Euryarchaeota archaeon]
MAGLEFQVSFEFLVKLAVVVGAGLLVGLEREHRTDKKLVIAGVRTFPLIAVAGLLTQQLAIASDTGLVVAFGLAMAGIFAISMFVVRHLLGETGFTTPMSIFVIYLVGVMVGYGFLLEGTIIAVMTTGLLLTKRRLHLIAHHLSDDEISAALQFVTIAFILYPLSPDGPLDPWGIWNLRTIILIVVFVSAFSFASFIGMRQIGARRGIVAAGLLGGLVNSEATAASLGQIAAANPSLVAHAAAGTLLATAAMFGRNLAIAAFVDPSLRLAQVLLIPAAAMACICVGASFLKHDRDVDDAATIALKNPFAIWPAVKFGALFALLAGFAFFASGRGESGVYATALGGFIHAAAVVASVTLLYASGTIPLKVAALTAVAAMTLSTVNKFIIVRSANKKVAERVALPIAAAAAVGVAALVIIEFYARLPA